MRSETGSRKPEQPNYLVSDFRLPISDFRVFGIVNITEDSFSDGGRFLTTDAAIAQARTLAKDADVIDLGAAASNPESKPVAPETEIARLAPVVAALKRDGCAVSIDSFSIEVQRWALTQDIDYLNDIHGFSDAAFYPDLARAKAKLIVMHAVQGEGRATPMDVRPSEIVPRCLRFFEKRLAALENAGIDRSRIILDPGMGFFLGRDPQASIAMLRALPQLKSAFGLPSLVSVSRKSFLRALTGRGTEQIQAATLAAELFALTKGADFIRTHEPRPLRDAARIWHALADNSAAC
jgi:dihydropteroate synthase type 2